MGRILSSIICAVLCGAMVLSFGRGQKVSKCRDSLPAAPKYRIGEIRRADLRGQPILLLQISLSPESFNERDMSALAKRLTSEFCHDAQVSIAIADEFEAAKSPDLISDLMKKTPNPALRGAYNLDRVAGTYSLSFSTKRGKPLDEVRLTFEIHISSVGARED